MTDTSAIIGMLNSDMRDEHAAIVQYLQHAYAIGESGEACEIEAVARDEMRHFDWLAEAIVKLGGDPAVERGNVDLEGGGPVAWMGRDVAAEERAIAQYQQHIEAIDDAGIERLLRRILSDEQAHRDKFVSLSAELASEGKTAAAPLTARSGMEIPAHVRDALQTGVRHEYSVILQYLYHTFVMPECEVSRELEMQAINEMQHLGWLAEEVASGGGHPDIEHLELALEGGTAEMLEADIAAERAVTSAYTRQISQIDDTAVRDLLVRIRDHEIYHDELFSEMLAEVKEAEEPRGPGLGFTVGSLIEED